VRGLGGLCGRLGCLRMNFLFVSLVVLGLFVGVVYAVEQIVVLDLVIDLGLVAVALGGFSPELRGRGGAHRGYQVRPPRRMRGLVLRSKRPDRLR